MQRWNVDALNRKLYGIWSTWVTCVGILQRLGLGETKRLLIIARLAKRGPSPKEILFRISHTSVFANSMVFRFHTKVCAVFGGSRGIGKAISELVAVRGGNVAVISRYQDHTEWVCGPSASSYFTWTAFGSELRCQLFHISSEHRKASPTNSGTTQCTCQRCRE